MNKPLNDDEIARLMKKGGKIIKGDCGDCPFLRLYGYPVMYCLHAIVDGSTLCPYDYDLKRSREKYIELSETVEFWDKYTQSFIWGDEDVNVLE